LTFHFNPHNYMEEWQVTSPSGSVDLSFTPFFERLAKTDIKIVTSSVHHLVGHYKGSITLPQGKKIILTNLLGCIEDHYAKSYPIKKASPKGSLAFASAP